MFLEVSLSLSVPHKQSWASLIIYIFIYFANPTADGTIYNGEYENDKMHGEGTYLFPDGAKYVGEFRNNNFEGIMPLFALCLLVIKMFFFIFSFLNMFFSIKVLECTRHRTELVI